MLNLTAKRANYLPIYISVTASSTNQRRTFFVVVVANINADFVACGFYWSRNFNFTNSWSILNSLDIMAEN